MHQLFSSPKKCLLITFLLVITLVVLGWYGMQYAQQDKQGPKRSGAPVVVPVPRQAETGLITLSNAIVDAPYHESLNEIIGSTPDARMSVAAGHLPDGLSLDPVSGHIHGIATQNTENEYIFTIQVREPTGRIDEYQFAISVTTALP